VVRDGNRERIERGDSGGISCGVRSNVFSQTSGLCVPGDPRKIALLACTRKLIVILILFTLIPEVSDRRCPNSSDFRVCRTWRWRVRESSWRLGILL